MDSRPHVSVLIPTRDRRALLSRALTSALGQERRDLEVVVVDDGSVDDTAAYVGAHGDERVRLVRHSAPRGVAAARNSAITAASGEWVAFHDDDDVWAPTKVDRQLRTAEESAADYVYASAVLVDEQRRGVALLAAPEPREILRALIGRQVIPAGCSNVIAKADLVRALGGFDERLSVLADWDLWIRLAAAGRGAACPEVLVGYLQHPESMWLDASHDLRREFEYLVAKHAHVAASVGAAFDRVGFSRAVAWSHRRAGRRSRAVREYLQGAWRERSAGNVVRALAAALAGERLFSPQPEAPVPQPAWLDLYR